MISWKIWRAVHTPFVAHPIYWLRGLWVTHADHNSLLQRMEAQARWIGLGILGIGCILTVVGRFDLVILLIFGIPVLTIVIGIPAGVLFSGTWYGFMCAATTAITIRHERYQGRFLLLGATPYGLAGATWALGSIAVQRSIFLARMRMLLAPTYFMIFFIFLLTLPLVAIPAMNAPYDLQAQKNLHDWLTMFLIAFLGVIDLIQSANMGALIGMIVPVATNQLGSVYIGAILAYLISQIAIIIVSGILWLIVWPLVGIDNGLVWYFCGVLTVIILREIYTYILWRGLIRALDADYGELDAIVHIGF